MTNKNKSINYYYIINFNLNYMNYYSKTNLSKNLNQNLFNLILVSNPFFLYRFKIEIKEKNREYIEINEFLEIDSSFKKLFKL